PADSRCWRMARLYVCGEVKHASTSPRRRVVGNALCGVPSAALRVWRPAGVMAEKRAIPLLFDVWNATEAEDGTPRRAFPTAVRHTQRAFRQPAVSIWVG